MMGTIKEVPKHILTLFGFIEKTLDAAIENHRQNSTLVLLEFKANEIQKKESIFPLCYIKSID